MVLSRIAAGALLLGSPLAAQQQPTNAAPPITVTGQKVDDSQKVVCKVTDTGTLIPKRRCMTKEEWSEASGNAQGAMETLRQNQRARCMYGLQC